MEDLAISPDGRRIAFIKGSTLYVSRLDGTDRVQLVAAGADWPDWSPEGTRLVFRATAAIKIIEVGGGHAVTTVPGTDSTMVFPSWSPDGQRLVVTDGEPGGKTRIISFTLDGGAVLVAWPFEPAFRARTPDWQPS